MTNVNNEFSIDRLDFDALDQVSGGHHHGPNILFGRELLMAIAHTKAMVHADALSLRNGFHLPV